MKHIIEKNKIIYRFIIVECLEIYKYIAKAILKQCLFIVYCVMGKGRISSNIIYIAASNIHGETRDRGNCVGYISMENLHYLFNKETNINHKFPPEKLLPDSSRNL